MKDLSEIIDGSIALDAGPVREWGDLATDEQKAVTEYFDGERPGGPFAENLVAVAMLEAGAIGAEDVEVDGQGGETDIRLSNLIDGGHPLTTPDRQTARYTLTTGEEYVPADTESAPAQYDARNAASESARRRASRLI